MHIGCKKPDSFSVLKTYSKKFSFLFIRSLTNLKIHSFNHVSRKKIIWKNTIFFLLTINHRRVCGMYHILYIFPILSSFSWKPSSFCNSGLNFFFWRSTSVDDVFWFRFAGSYKLWRWASTEAMDWDNAKNAVFTRNFLRVKIIYQIIPLV